MENKAGGWVGIRVCGWREEGRLKNRKKPHVATAYSSEGRGEETGTVGRTQLVEDLVS